MLLADWLISIPHHMTLLPSVKDAMESVYSKEFKEDYFSLTLWTSPLSEM